MRTLRRAFLLLAFLAVVLPAVQATAVESPAQNALIIQGGKLLLSALQGTDSDTVKATRDHLIP